MDKNGAKCNMGFGRACDKKHPLVVFGAPRTALQPDRLPLDRPNFLLLSRHHFRSFFPLWVSSGGIGFDILCLIWHWWDVVDIRRSITAWPATAAQLLGQRIAFCLLSLRCHGVVSGTSSPSSCLAPSLHPGLTLASRKAEFFVPFNLLIDSLAVTLRSAIPGVSLATSDSFRHACLLCTDDLVVLTASQADLQIVALSLCGACVLSAPVTSSVFRLSSSALGWLS